MTMLTCWSIQKKEIALMQSMKKLRLYSKTFAISDKRMYFVEN